MSVFYKTIWEGAKASWSLQWRHDECETVSNHQRLYCLSNCRFRCRSKNHQSSASVAFVRGIHRWPVNSPHKRPLTRKMFPFDDVFIMISKISLSPQSRWSHTQNKCDPNIIRTDQIREWNMSYYTKYQRQQLENETSKSMPFQWLPSSCITTCVLWTLWWRPLVVISLNMQIIYSEQTNQSKAILDIWRHKVYISRHCSLPNQLNLIRTCFDKCKWWNFFVLMYSC